MARKKTPTTLTNPRDFDHLSASSFSLFEQCPALWANNYVLGNRDERKNKYAAIGTAGHNIADAYIKDQCKPEDHPELELIPKEEKKSVIAYAKSLEELKPRTIGSEVELRHDWLEGAPPILLRMDWFGNSIDGSFLILDHKSNRSYEGAQEWMKKIQPLVYVYSARQLYPGYPRYRFRIGYINLGMTAEWETTEEEAQLTHLRLVDNWTGMTKYYERSTPGTIDAYPETFNDHCGRCHISKNCKEFKRKTSEIVQVAGMVLDGMTPVDRYMQLAQIKKVCEDTMSSIEEEVKEQVEAGARIGNSTHKFAMVPGRKSRSISFEKFWSFVTEKADENGDPDLMGSVYAEGESLFTVKMGGVTAFLKRRPDLKKELEELIESKEGSLSLKIIEEIVDK